MRQFGFHPAFLDFATMQGYVGGLPNGVMRKRSLICGFVRNGYFYTRTAAAKAIAQWPAVAAA
jgi:hypothetical protein